MRTFDDVPATRARVPLLLGLFGASGSGKTFSALRLATGIQRVTGGEIFVVDTESRRALHYADRFKFRHVEFRSPHGPLDYLAALEHCVKKNALTVIIDSMSHEHEGVGGVLETHSAEAERLAKQWNTSVDKAKMAAWGKPKSDRRRLINTILQMPINVISCFRAKEKLKIEAGRDPKPMGWMPIAGEEFVYEQTVNMLLYPGSRGVPTWQTDEIGERQMLKLPEQFRDLFAQSKQLDEDLGEALAKWAAGGEVTRAAELRAAIRAAESQADLDVVAKQIAEAKEKRTVSPAEYRESRELWATRRDEITPPEPGSGG